MDGRRRWLIAAIVVALVVYATMWVGYLSQWSWLDAMDDRALDAAHGYGTAHPGWVLGWDLFCTVFGPAAFRLVTLALIIVAFVRRQVTVAVFLILSIELSGLVTETAKYLADRPRPSTALVHAPSSSFPSGHAVGVLVSVGALLIVGLPLLRAAWRRRLVVLGVLLVAAIGAGRVILNVHHPSDIIAGWALGFAWLTFCALVVPPRRRPVSEPDGTPVAPGTAR
jgi:membrane-associated phospholipid phosphatase